MLSAERYEPWSDRPREQLRALYRDLLVAGRLWGRLLELDPASELAHREIIRERLEAGDRAGAIRQFDRLRTVLRDELGISPDPQSLALYERVLAFEERDVPTPAERARALLAWGTVHWERSELAVAGRAAAEARALAVDAGLGRELADASELLSLIAYAQGRWREVFASQFVETVERSPELAPFVFDANLCMSEFALHEANGLAEIADFAGQLLSVEPPQGKSQAHALGLLLRGEVGLFEGRDLATAVSHLGASLRLYEANSSATGAALATERLAQAEWARGDAASARRLHRRALERAVASPVSSHLLPLVYGGLLEAAETESAVALVAEAETSLARTHPCAPCSMSFHVGASKVCAQHVGEHERARSHLERAERIAGMWHGGPWHAAVAEARAILRAAEHADPGETRALLAGAAEGFATSGRLRDADRCRRALTQLV
ncbi:MAG: transcriptional activator domain-containing protein [Dehalococcoidia bacterium]|nr:transcriptional activator domain-containing protein [Dehalococcoidia bacterium]